MIVVGSGLTATVDPERGGKITSLIDASGAEWLAQRASDAPRERGRLFIEAEMCGWDECAPSIVPCAIDGKPVPDHGDLWDQPFATEGDTVHAIGASLDYRFERTIVPSAHGLRLAYAAAARTQTIPFLWAAHPQFLAPPGTRVEVPGLTNVVDVLAEAPRPIAWNPTVASIDSVDDGGCRKVYALPEQAMTTATLVRPNGSRLRLDWTVTTPYLGLWFDKGAYAREAIIAIEPSTGYFDSLATAVANNRVATLYPGHQLAWSLTLSVG